MNLEIRPMKLEDYDAVIRIWNESEGLTMRDSDSREAIGRYLARNPGMSFVAIWGSEVVGGVLVGTDGRRGYLQHLAVAGSYRGRGIGRQLVAAAVDGLKKEGIEKTHLFVHAVNTTAQNFYEELGWFVRDEIRMFSFNSGTNRNI
ncbi:GNAT family N-acetyltransferase [Hahella sp. CCB-MM4]|uniref:GNAT family N-acetyltransferase n=1 Tax=Hahella sp. (strain CCB-MM4) TaxID=1926491 RepID=UPI000B9B7EF6|nr:GNAT family N-acetyltransferase [Hahella sp. CCB-MM4]OZG75200.1 GNAT family N-acetyltransferase [Hahella sp. CCB-MM4]